MKSYQRVGLSLLLLAACATWTAAKDSAAVKKGDKLQALANLHPDNQKNLLYTLNYQLPGVMIPVCSEIIVTKMGSKEMEFTYQGAAYTLAYEGFTKKAGVSFEKAVLTYFGPACDKAKMQKLGAADQEGIRVGRVKEGMTRDGVLFAMGRPPVHVNPDLNAPEYRYWKNRFATTLIEFDDKGHVSAIK